MTKMLLTAGSKLTYFSLTGGRAESTRLAFAIGGVPFEDHRVEFKDWPTLKPTTTWGSLPILELSDGRIVTQQKAILRLAGKDAGLYPSDDLFLSAKCDELIDALEDIMAKTNPIGQGLPKEEKEAKRLEACQKGGVTYEILAKVDKSIQDNFHF